MLPTNCLVIFKNGTVILRLKGIIESEILGTSQISKQAPVTATRTYKTLPILFKIGPKILA